MQTNKEPLPICNIYRDAQGNLHRVAASIEPLNSWKRVQAIVGNVLTEAARTYGRPQNEP